MHDRTSERVVLLAGGGSRRMGRDKRWLDVGGKPLLRHLADVLEPLSALRIVCCDRESAPRIRETLPGWQVALDAEQHAGPLAALAALDAADSVVAAVDLPALATGTLRALPQFAAPHHLAVIPVAAEQLQPLAAWYRAAAFDRFRAAAGRGQQSIMRALRDWPDERIRRVTAQDAKRDPGAWDTEFINVNTPQEWQRWRDNCFCSD